ncbi:MAG: hypothetical protein HYX55_01990 [Chloroflexi bacterium]|nr:hypothetical protein [Chloroflexota bacterium]
MVRSRALPTCAALLIALVLAGCAGSQSTATRSATMATLPGGPTLTTQMYFPGVTANDGDGYLGAHTFVLATA